MLFQNDLNVLHDDNGVFSDKSASAVDYGRDSFVLPLVAAQDYLYLGLYKPFNKVYAEMKVVNTVANIFTAEYWNGSAWTALVNFWDLSQGFTRSGFMQWKKPNDWASTVVNSDLLYWVRLKPNFDHSALTELQGLNIVYADDQDLQNEFSRVADYKASLLSYITYQQAVRDDIVQALRNKGNVKYNEKFINVSKWDLLDADEVRRGATYACLAKIFFELSDNVDDKWYQRHKDYTEKANKALELFALSLDTNDTGLDDKSKLVQRQSVSLVRT